MNVKLCLASWAIAAALAPSRAHAQADVEGAGYVVGPGWTVHPSASVETGYVSNVFYESSSENPLGSGLLSVAARVALRPRAAGTLSPVPAADESSDAVRSESPGAARGVSNPTVTGDADGELVYNEYLTGTDTAQAQRSLGIRLRGKVLVLPGRPVSLMVDDVFQRDTRPVNFESRNNLPRDVNRFGVAARWQPPGRALWGLLAYDNTVDRFEAGAVAFANRVQHDVSLRVVWQYLPVTRFYATASQGYYDTLNASDNELAGIEYKHRAMPLTVGLGAASAITELLTVRVESGWVSGFYDREQSYNSLQMLTKVGYRYSPLGRVSFLVQRDFQDSINANYFADWTFRADVNQDIGVFGLAGEVEYRRRNYQGIPDGVSMTVDTRADDIALVGLTGSYGNLGWFRSFVSYNYRMVSTDFRDRDGDDPSYSRHQMMVGASAAF